MDPTASDPGQGQPPDGAVAAPTRAAAFFDLDKTVVAKSSTLAFSRPLRREGLISTAAAFKVAVAQLSYQLFGADHDRMERSRVALLELTRGWQAERVQQLVRETLQEVIDPLIYAEALDAFAEHRRAGRTLYLVSTSGVEVVRPLAEYLGVPHTIATRAGIGADGRYDGTMQFYAYGQHKAHAMRSEAASRGLDLAGSYAYSDSVTDLPMLEAVGHPVVVNPDRELRAIALARGWEVRTWTRPVALRARLRRLPRPPAELLLGAAGAAAVAAIRWWWSGQKRSRRAKTLAT